MENQEGGELPTHFNGEDWMDHEFLNWPNNSDYSMFSRLINTEWPENENYPSLPLEKPVDEPVSNLPYKSTITLDANGLLAVGVKESFVPTSSNKPSLSCNGSLPLMVSRDDSISSCTDEGLLISNDSVLVQDQSTNGPIPTDSSALVPELSGFYPSYFCLDDQLSCTNSSFGLNDSILARKQEAHFHSSSKVPLIDSSRSAIPITDPHSHLSISDETPQSCLSGSILNRNQPNLGPTSTYSTSRGPNNSILMRSRQVIVPNLGYNTPYVGSNGSISMQNQSKLGPCSTTYTSSFGLNDSTMENEQAIVPSLGDTTHFLGSNCSIPMEDRTNLGSFTMAYTSSFGLNDSVARNQQAIVPCLGNATHFLGSNGSISMENQTDLGSCSMAYTSLSGLNDSVMGNQQAYLSSMGNRPLVGPNGSLSMRNELAHVLRIGNNPSFQNVPTPLPNISNVTWSTSNGSFPVSHKHLGDHDPNSLSTSLLGSNGPPIVMNRLGFVPSQNNQDESNRNWSLGDRKNTSISSNFFNAGHVTGSSSEKKSLMGDGGPSICRKCGKFFRNRYSLGGHMSHHSQKIKKEAILAAKLKNLGGNNNSKDSAHASSSKKNLGIERKKSKFSKDDKGSTLKRSPDEMGDRVP